MCFESVHNRKHSDQRHHTDRDARRRHIRNKSAKPISGAS
ncbi:hypothetical protein D049_3506A, partial [Vibrio parahaemolyticus VPTS-2010]